MLRAVAQGEVSPCQSAYEAALNFIAMFIKIIAETLIMQRCFRFRRSTGECLGISILRAVSQGEASPWQFIDEAGLELHRNGGKDHWQDDDHASLLSGSCHAQEENVWEFTYIYSRRGATRGQAMTVC